MIKYAVARRGYLMNRLSRNAKARLFITPNGSLVPRSDLQIKRFPRKELPRQLARCLRHLPAKASAAQVRADTDSEEDLGWLFI